MARAQSVVLNGDCQKLLTEYPDNSFDSLITDPPAGISFMGKDWDSNKGGRDSWINWLRNVMRECFRVLKPGAHGLVWAIPRTSHWTATALEDAGFEIRDVVTHLFGNGFPKSHNIEKATGDKRFEGWGTALKPASEHWILIRKPISEKTVAANVLKWGTGGLNIDGSRIATKDSLNGGAYSPGERKRSESAWGGGVGGGVMKGTRAEFTQPQGRFPANLVLSHSPNCTDDACDMFECPVALLDEQSGNRPSAGKYKDSTLKKDIRLNSCFGVGGRPTAYAGETGGASRFFYCPKASKTDKGLDNDHPTVKSIKLMRYLIKLVTPPDGLILDPFLGSGSTGVAAFRDGFRFIGIEQDYNYYNIAKSRINSEQVRAASNG